MGNTQQVWILYCIVLVLNFLIMKKQRTAAKRPGIERGTVKINQPRYFENPLAFKKSKMYLSHGNKKFFGEEVLLLSSQETRDCRLVPS